MLQLYALWKKNFKNLWEGGLAPSQKMCVFFQTRPFSKPNLKIKLIGAPPAEILAYTADGGIYPT